jgi:signal transduction histidine kinase
LGDDVESLVEQLGGGVAIALAIQLALLGAWLVARERKPSAARAVAPVRAVALWLGPCVVVGALAAACLLRGLAQQSLPPLAEIALSAALVGSFAALALRAGSLLGDDRRYRELVDSAPVGIVACDRTGQVRIVNQPMWRMLGAPEALPASKFGNLLTHPAVVNGGGAEIARRALEAGATLSTEASYDSMWRGTRIVRVTAGPLQDPGGEIAGAVLLAEDVTDGKAIQHHLREGKRVAAMTRLAALIAHEANDALACVQSNLTRLAEGVQGHDAELAEVVAESADSVSRAIALMRDLQDGARAESDDDDALETTALAPLMRSCVRIAAAHAGYRQVTDEQYADVPPLRGSTSLLRQALMNVVLNAVEAAGERGKVRVATRREDDFAVVRISDDGPGIPPQNAERIFEPFFATKSARAGAGLGLYLAREIVRSHHGEIRLVASEGPGATFEIRLPVVVGGATSQEGPDAT